MRLKARKLLAKSGESLVKELDGFSGKYKGSFAVHYFTDEKSLGTEHHSYYIISQSCLNDLPEEFVDQGLKQARKDLMKKFGREQREVKR